VSGLRGPLFDTIPIPVSLWNETGSIIDCNDSMVRFLKCDTKKNCLERFFAYSTEFQPDGTSSREKADFLREYAIAHGQASYKWTHLIDGEVVEVEAVCVHYLNEGKPFVAAYAQDLREIRRREIAEEESRAKTQFLARMSHEIRTPMNAVLGVTEMQMQKKGLPPETEEAFSRIYTSSSLLLQIINDILDLSRVEAGKMEIITDKYETASMIVDTVQLNLMHIGSKPIEFKLNVDERVPTFLTGDELRIKQVMNNILSNAFKYTDEGLVSLDVRVIEGENNQAVLVFQVKDTGQGMTREQIASLFEIEFTRFNAKNNRIIEGSGLGMNIAYQLVKMMGGNIKVESLPGIGTTFNVEIPQSVSGNEKLGKKTVENLQNLETAQRALRRLSRLANIHMPYGKVLVVDDVESNLYVAKGLLMPYKLTIDTVDSGRAAVHKIRNGHVYDIIFMDHMMPGMDGIEAAKKIQELGYNHPIIALTANTVKGQSELFMKNGFAGFISKPVDVNQLNTYLLRLIRDKQPPEVLAAAARDQEKEMQNTGFADDKVVPGDISARLKESFVRDAKRSIEAIAAVINRDHIDVPGFKIYIIHTHAMKSALLNIGEPILSVVAGALEQAGREGDIKTIQSLTHGFIKRLEQITDATAEALALGAQAALAKSEKGLTKDMTVSETEQPGEQAQPSEVADQEEKTIFVVDDSDTNLILAEEALEDYYNVFTIISAAQMFKMIQKKKPHLILLDIQMPEMDGFEAMEKIKADPALTSIPVVFLTATVTPEIATKARKLGAADIVSKPFTAEGLQSKVSEWLSKPGAKPTVLIIDDTPMVISALSRILLPLYSVKVAKDGEEGLRLASRHPIDLILLDINMPGLSGFDVLGKMKETPEVRGVPVIFITGSEEAEDESQGFRMGAVDYIKKPFSEENVLHRVDLHIHGGKVV